MRWRVKPVVTGNQFHPPSQTNNSCFTGYSQGTHQSCPGSTRQLALLHEQLYSTHAHWKQIVVFGVVDKKPVLNYDLIATIHHPCQSCKLKFLKNTWKQEFPVLGLKIQVWRKHHILLCLDTRYICAISLAKLGVAMQWCADPGFQSPEYFHVKCSINVSEKQRNHCQSGRWVLHYKINSWATSLRASLCVMWSCLYLVKWNLFLMYSAHKSCTARACLNLREMTQWLNPA